MARTVAGNHPMEVGARRPSRVCRADQRLLILSGLERRDVHGHRRAVGDTEPRPEVERYRGRTTHLVGIDSGGDDLHLSRREPRRQQGRTHGLGDCDDDIHAPQGAGAAHREYDPARGDEAGWRAGVPQESARPNGEGDGVTVVRVYDVGPPGERLRFDQVATSLSLSARNQGGLRAKKMAAVN